jgi:hypothetical protein
MGRDMNYVSSVAERAIHSVDRLINQAMTYAWTSTLEHRCPGKEFTPQPWAVQIFAEENDGDRNSCAPEPHLLTADDLPLE